MNDAEVTPGIERAEYVQRRLRMGDALPPSSIAVFAANTHKYMSEDVPYLYHHNTDLLYLTGCAEPASVLLVENVTEENARFLLFTQPRDTTRELWEGPVCGTGDDVRNHFAVHDVLCTEQLPTIFESILQDAKQVFMDHEHNPFLCDPSICLPPQAQELLMERWKYGVKPKTLLMTQRLVKSPAELELMRRSCSIVSEALNDAMAHTSVLDRSGLSSERAIEARLEYACKMRGADRLAFPSVVAMGRNATILHYMDNSQVAQKGDLVMVDAGCEVHGYSSDVSRTWPVAGRFSGPQRDLYDLVLSVQKSCIQNANTSRTVQGEPVSLDALHFYATRELVQGLLDLGFMLGENVESALHSGIYSRYFPHATGHYLGLDVHDTHGKSKSTPLTQNMVITIEPGLYCTLDDASAPEQFRGVGMRIEDDVVVGSATSEPEVLSARAVKEIDDVEHLVGSET